MKLNIIDSSVAVKWFIGEESGRDRAVAILHSILSDPREYAVPELFFNEMLSVLCRLFDSVDRIHPLLSALEGLGLKRIGNGHELLSEAAAIAKEYDLTGHDAVFAATAKLTNGVWITADAKALAKLSGFKHARLL